MMSPSPLLRRLLLLAVAASAAAPAGGGCSTGCDVAVAYYYIKPSQNLTYIGSLFGIDDYRGLAAYNAGYPNPDYIPAGEPILVNFTCRCLALPGAPLSTYLAGSFPYRVSPGDTYSSIAALYNNLTTAVWLEATNRYPSNSVGDGLTVNVTVNCSCGDPAVSPDLRLFLTYPLSDGETLVSVGAKFGFLLQSQMDLLRRYNPGMEEGVRGSRLAYIPLQDSEGFSKAPITDSPFARGTGARKLVQTVIAADPSNGSPKSGGVTVIPIPTYSPIGSPKSGDVGTVLPTDSPNGSPKSEGAGSALPTDSPVAHGYGPSRKKRITIYIIAGISSLFGVCIILLPFVLWYKKQRGSRNAPRIESFLQKQGTSHPQRYSYSEVRRMTKSFAHKLGQGGCGAVYRGNLPDGREIAVKMLKDTEGNSEDFMNEVASISRTSHINVITLLGFCLQGSKRALLYEYMPNGSLEQYTFGSSSAEGDNTLTWDKLFDIVFGIARGLEYLHAGCNTRIVHFDIKPQNILLDQDFCPKISDFGLAKLCRQKESKISIAGARGTRGYIAPEVFSRNYGPVSSKSDVYSYGMVVLDLVGGRKQIEVGTDSSSKYFPQCLYDNLDQFCGATSCEISSEITELVRKMTIVGLWCIQFAPADRPSMSKVLDMLESSTVNLQMPPKAFYAG